MRKSDHTRERILESALQLFATQGYDATTVAEIEQAAGLSAGSGAIHRYFDSKEALVVAVLRELSSRFAQLRGRVAEIVRLDDHRRELERFADLIIELWIENFGAMALLSDGRSFSPPTRAILAEVIDEGYQWYVDWLSLRIADPDIDIPSTAILMAGGLAPYGQQVTLLDTPPLGVVPERPLEAWIDHWGEFVDRHATTSARVV